MVSDDTGVLIEPDVSRTMAGMGGATSYSIVEGEFYLKALPQPDKQFVKKLFKVSRTRSHMKQKIWLCLLSSMKAIWSK